MSRDPRPNRRFPNRKLLVVVEFISIMREQIEKKIVDALQLQGQIIQIGLRECMREYQEREYAVVEAVRVMHMEMEEAINVLSQRIEERIRTVEDRLEAMKQNTIVHQEKSGGVEVQDAQMRSGAEPNQRTLESTLRCLETLATRLEAQIGPLVNSSSVDAPTSLSAVSSVALPSPLSSAPSPSAAVCPVAAAQSARPPPEGCDDSEEATTVSQEDNAEGLPITTAAAEGIKEEENATQADDSEEFLMKAVGGTKERTEQGHNANRLLMKAPEETKQKEESTEQGYSIDHLMKSEEGNQESTTQGDNSEDFLVKEAEEMKDVSLEEADNWETLLMKAMQET